MGTLSVEFGPFHCSDTVTSWSDIHCVSVLESALGIIFKSRHGHEQVYVYLVQTQNIVPDIEWAVSISKVAVKLHEHLVHLWGLL
jgi:hypothetical protein